MYLKVSKSAKAPLSVENTGRQQDIAFGLDAYTATVSST